jgi:hypothetical protein
VGAFHIQLQASAIADICAGTHSSDGLLMPQKKDQLPPDLRYFNTTQK